MRVTLVMMLMLAALPFATTPAVSEESEAADAKKEEFKVPPGFRTRTRGKHTVYCREETTMGTRFLSVRCYDEEGIRELLAAQRDQQSKVDQMRKICGQTGSCGGT